MAANLSASNVNVPGMIDWTKCIFCQKITGSSTKTECPGLSTRADSGKGYVTLADAVNVFIQSDAMPQGIDIRYWDEGDGIAETCKRHLAFWHLKCRNLLHWNTVARLRKRIHCEHSQIDDQNIIETETDNFEYDTPTSSKIFKTTSTRASSGPITCSFSPICFICETPGGDKLRQVLTTDLNNKVEKCAKFLHDNRLLAKFIDGDLIAVEAKYHVTCLLTLYRKCSKLKIRTEDCDNELLNIDSTQEVNGYSLALAQVVSYIEDLQCNQETPVVLKLSHLSKIYTEQLTHYEVPITSKANSTRLKERLLSMLPNFTAINHGCNVLLTCNDNIGATLKDLSESSDLYAMHLMHTAKLIRSKMFSSVKEPFNGSFTDSCQLDSVPQELLTLVSTLLEGPRTVNAIVQTNNQAALSIAQLIIFNAVKRPHTPAFSNDAQRPTMHRHPVSQETPMPIYLGMMLHAATRKKKIVDKCFKLGLSISYDRVQQISNKIANSVCAAFDREEIVCPPSLQDGLFTVAAVDNIDHNLSSTTAQSSFHGTAISLMQVATSLNPNRVMNQSFKDISDSCNLIKLPPSYTDVPPCVLPSSTPQIPHQDIVLTDTVNSISGEYHWLDAVNECITNDTEPCNVSWSSFHAARQNDNACNRSIISLLPLFRHSANTCAMIRHALSVVWTAVHQLNSEQIPVVTFDQPLYALAKQIQWHWPERFGEDKFVIMMGGLHIEMASLRMLGHWLDGCGWVQCLVEAGVATSGVAESFIHASDVKRTRYAHTVTAAVLYILQKRCYMDYCNEIENGEPLSFSEWVVHRCNTSTQFHYWNTVLLLEIAMLTFVRSIRSGNFSLYIEALQLLAPWFHSLDQTHYARWLTVHIRDMLSLSKSHPDVASEFARGKFTICKTNHKFSSISIDHAHEQLNALIKGDGGAVGLTENDAALIRWTISGPEIIRILEEFEGNDRHVTLNESNKHHEQTPSYQKRYIQDVSNFLLVLDELNPFMITSSDDLISLDARIIADQSVYNTVKNAYSIGFDQFQKFVNERLLGSMSLLAPLHRNKLALFTFKAHKKDSKQLKINNLKGDCELFSRLFIACQNRSGDIDDFFSHENQTYPPSLSQNGTIRFGTKSDLLKCLNDLSDTTIEVNELQVDTCIIDGAVMVQMLKPGTSKTFADYSQNIVLPYITSRCHNVARLDVVFDIYVLNSLKCATRQKRGVGARTRVSAATKIPSNWQDFLRVNENKTELFHFLAKFIVSSNSLVCSKKIFVTFDDRVLCTDKECDLNLIDPCSHEEADTRLILHCLHAAKNGSSRVVIRTVDTDVLVLAVAFFQKLELDQLWLHFGVGTNSRLISVHELTRALGPSKCTALPIFHALTGCDTTSSFSGKGKKTAWEAWRMYPTVTEAFINLYTLSDNVIDDATLSVLERFVIIMYERTSECTDLNTARKHLFTKRSLKMESLPPTSDAFLQHVKRVVYQSVHIWGQCLNKQPVLLNPCNWGWVREQGEQLVPLWMTTSEVSEVCSNLIRSCSCRKGCFERCTCVKNNLECTALCQCDGDCIRQQI